MIDLVSVSSGTGAAGNARRFRAGWAGVPHGILGRGSITSRGEPRRRVGAMQDMLMVFQDFSHATLIHHFAATRAAVGAVGVSFGNKCVRL